VSKGYRFEDNSAEVLRVLKARSREAVREVAEDLLGTANRTIPLDTGVLQASGEVSVSPTSAEATVSYSTPYAVRQHEDLSYRHAPGRRARWLDLAMRENSSRYLARMRSKVWGV